MFHLEFQQNQHTSSIVVPQPSVVTEVKPCDINKKLQERCDREFKESKTNHPNKNIQNSNKENIEDSLSAKSINDEESNHPFIYECNRTLLVFLCMSEDYIMKCPMCHYETKYIVQHLNKSKNCNIPGELTIFKDQFGLYKENYRKEQHRKRQEKRVSLKKHAILRFSVVFQGFSSIKCVFGQKCLF